VTFWTLLIMAMKEELVSVGRYSWFGVEKPGEAVVNVVMNLWIP
jgi:hypothetical protein